MRPSGVFGRRALAAFLCLCLLLWSVMPVASHTATAADALHDHPEMLAGHAHSHALEEDLYRAVPCTVTRTMRPITTIARRC